MSKIRLIWIFGTYSRGLLGALWAFHFRILRVWFMQLLVLRRPLLKDYGQILFISLTVRGRSWLGHLVDPERLALLAINIRGAHITHLTGLLQLELISLIHNIGINWFMFSSLTLLRLACSRDHHIREPLLLRHLDHIHRGLWDSSLHWAWLWLELLRSSETLVWSFLWCHALCHILFLLTSSYMIIAYIIIFRDMILSVVRYSIMRYKTWLIQGWSTCLGQVWPPIPCLHILHMQFHLLVFSRLIWILMVLMVIWYFRIFRVEDLVQLTWVHHFAVV